MRFFRKRRWAKAIIAERKGWRTETKSEEYWPGIFIYYNCKAKGAKEDSAQFLFRAAETGYDFHGPKISKPGWWTLGMSFTSDGSVHYYVREGVENLTAKDHVASRFPYGYRAEWFDTFFFNVVNPDDGKTWSTPWIIDDPALYVR